MLRTVLINLAILLPLALAGVAGFEFHLRGKHAEQARVEFSALRESRPDIQFDLYRQIYTDRRDTAYEYDHWPNARVRLEKGYYDFTLRTNRDGLREVEDYDELPASVIFLGDSVVEGAAVENEQTMDSVFEAESGVTALNFGVASRGTYLEYEYLKAKYRPAYNARAIVLGYCINDFSEAHYVRYFDEELGNWFLLRYLDDGMDLQRGALYRMSRLPLLGTAIGALHRVWMESEIGKGLWRGVYDGAPPPAPAVPWPAAQVTAAQRALSAHHLGLVRDFAAAIDARLVVAVFPSRAQLTTRYEPGARAQDVLIGILDELRIEYVDFHQPFRAAVAQQPDSDWYHDEIHFRQEGHRLVGATLAKLLAGS